MALRNRPREMDFLARPLSAQTLGLLHAFMDEHARLPQGSRLVDWIGSDHVGRMISAAERDMHIWETGRNDIESPYMRDFVQHATSAKVTFERAIINGMKDLVGDVATKDARAIDAIESFHETIDQAYAQYASAIDLLVRNLSSNQRQGHTRTSLSALERCFDSLDEYEQSFEEAIGEIGSACERYRENHRNGRSGGNRFDGDVIRAKFGKQPGGHVYDQDADVSDMREAATGESVRPLRPRTIDGPFPM